MKFFATEEIKDIIFALFILTIIFAYPNLFDINLLMIYFIAVVVGFLFHELAHKFSAQKFGCYAKFKAWPFGLFFGLFFAIISFGNLKFAAPGAVLIFPFRFGRWGFKSIRLTTKESGMISASGPLVNIIFASIFSFITFPYAGFLALINAWLAFFNLLPVPPLDGSKIMRWNPFIWLLMFGASFALILPYFL
jgi:Zn-dependent protease